MKFAAGREISPIPLFPKGGARRNLKVAVIGAGYAGLAAAVELARHGVPVTVFEAAKHLGGRARRVNYRGEVLDNGQHILLGAYHETLRLLRLTGAGERDLLRRPLHLEIPGRFRLSAPRLPSPLHLLFGLLLANGLSASERLRAVRFMLAMRRQGFRLPRDTDAASFLLQHGQAGNLRDCLWAPLCVAALNTPLEAASAQVFMNVLRDGLNGPRADSDLLLPLSDLTRLFPEKAAAYVQSAGGEIRLSSPVRAIRREQGGLVLEGSAGAPSPRFDRIVCAVPPRRLASLTDDLPELAAAAALANRLTYQPIYTVFLRYPEQVRLPQPMLGMVGGLAQWVFDHGWLNRQAGLLCTVISAGGEHESLDHDRLARRIHAELDALFGGLPPPRWYKVIAEKRATFSCTPGLERPEQATPLENFYLAGDYTAGEYPATLEGAVRSGVKCAQLILEKP
jgi:squalene-associated FAD-dependent desaturase